MGVLGNSSLFASVLNRDPTIPHGIIYYDMIENAAIGCNSAVLFFPPAWRPTFEKKPRNGPPQRACFSSVTQACQLLVCPHAGTSMAILWVYHQGHGISTPFQDSLEWCRLVQSQEEPAKVGRRRSRKEKKEGKMAAGSANPPR